MAQRRQKVLLIGATGYQRNLDDVRIECYDWMKVSGIKSIRDFDTIIIDLLPLVSQELRDTIDWGNFFKKLDFAVAMDVLCNAGIFIIIGDPRFNVKYNGAFGEDVEETFLHWTGISFYWSSEPGDTVSFAEGPFYLEYANYIANLEQWKYSLEACELDEKKMSEYFNLLVLKEKSMSVRLNKNIFCKNRYENALSFIIRYELVENKYSQTKARKTYGPMIFLPEVSLSHDEAVQCVLADICDIETDLPEPAWVDQLNAPGQEEIDEKIVHIKERIGLEVKTLEEADAQKQECRKCLKLLYEREYALELVVRDILRELGAEVEDPTENNKEDGWVVVKGGDKTYEGVIEIKSTRSDTFGEDGRKQLLDWIDRGRTLRGKNYKGLFIGNNAVDKPPNEREKAFSDSWVNAAELSQICVFKTEDLYVLHLLNSSGKLSLGDLWKKIFETNGILDMQEYMEALEPKDITAKHSG